MCSSHNPEGVRIIIVAKKINLEKKRNTPVMRGRSKTLTHAKQRHKGLLDLTLPIPAPPLKRSQSAEVGQRWPIVGGGMGIFIWVVGRRER